jgi:hypothetical protein
LNKRNSHRNEESCLLENNMRKRAQDIEYNWLANEECFNVNKLKCQLENCKRVVEIKKTSESLKKIDDSFILNSKQLFLFNRVLNHYLSSSKEQLLLHVNDEVERSKSLCIDMIFRHMHYHVH